MRPSVFLLLSLAALGRAQSLSYTLLASGEGSAPPPRFDGAIAYDEPGRQIFLFGGSSGSAKNDLWSYSLARRQWAEVNVSGDRPPARFGHTMVFDPVRRRLVVFGGQASGFFSDTWAFDIAGGSWTQLARDGAGPSRRYGHSGIYDTQRDRLIISHGFTDAGRFDDTWAFDLRANEWRDVSPSSGRPLRRCLHHAVYDAGNDQMLLYGGCASGAGPCPLGDLWSYNLSTQRWTEITGSAKPAARQHYGMVFDSVRRRLVLFGGAGGGDLNDTWEFEPASRQWRQLELAGAPPSPRSRHESAYAADRGNAFFFGGSTSTGLTNELWMLGPGFAVPTPTFSGSAVVNAFSGAAGPLAPGEIATIYGTGLGPIDGIAYTFDPLTGRLPVSGPGVSVTFNGVPAPLYYSQSGQLNVQVPFELQGLSAADLVVTANGRASAPVNVAMAPTSPGLHPSVFLPNGSTNSPENPAPAGSIVILYATGQGITTPPSVTGAYPSSEFPEPAAPATLRIGGRAAELLFRGQAPGTAGVMQINARIPTDAEPGPAAVTLEIGGVASQAGVAVHVRR